MGDQLCQGQDTFYFKYPSLDTVWCNTDKQQPDFVYRTKSGCCAFLKRLMFTTFLKKDKMLYRVVQEYAHRRNIMEKQRAIEIVTADLQAS